MSFSSPLPSTDLTIEVELSRFITDSTGNGRGRGRGTGTEGALGTVTSSVSLGFIIANAGEPVEVVEAGESECRRASSGEAVIRRVPEEGDEMEELLVGRRTLAENLVNDSGETV